MVRIPLCIGRKPGDAFPLVVPVQAVVFVLLQAYLAHEWAISEAHFTPGAANRLVFVLSAIFVGSLLLHEIGHAAAARDADIPVYGIVMTGFGAATCMPGWAGPGKDLRATLGGPAVSGALAFAGAAIHATTIRGPVDTAAEIAIAFFFLLNVVLFLSNLLPGLPLDGGRIVQAGVWRATRDPVRAAEIAWASTLVVAVLLDGWVVWRVLVEGDTAWVLTAGVFGFIVTSALPRARAYARGLRDVSGRAVADVLVPNPTTASAGMSPATAWRELFKPTGLSAIPVIDADGRPIGRVTHDRMLPLCGDDRRTLEEFAEPAPTVRSEMPVADLLRHPVVFDEGGLLAVVDAEGRYVGMTCLLRVQQVALGG